MANYFCMFSVKDEHIAFMQTNAGSAKAYYEGEVPAKAESLRERRSLLGSLLQDPDTIERLTVPADWPQDLPRDVVDIAVNANNAAMYHFVLNGSRAPVTGVRALFQSIYAELGSIIGLDKAREEFALKHADSRVLLDYLATLEPATIAANVAAWQSACESDTGVCEAELDCLCEEFSALKALLETAVSESKGLVWVLV